MNAPARREATLPCFILKREWGRDRWLYVRERPGDGGKDWGYTDDPKKAKKFSPYWAGRFRADCRHVGAPFTVTDACVGHASQCPCDPCEARRADQ